MNMRAMYAMDLEDECLLSYHDPMGYIEAIKASCLVLP